MSRLVAIPCAIREASAFVVRHHRHHLPPRGGIFALAAALDGLVGYGVDGFLALFYDELGRAYLEPHEAGLRSLLAAVRDQIGPQLGQIDRARKLLEKSER